MYTDCCRLRLHSYLPLQRIKISSHPIVNGDIAAIIAFYLLCTLNRKKMSRTAVYPGTFDPVTNGHLDLIKRGLALFDQVIVAVAHNPGKMPMFDVHERVGFLKAATQTWKNITIDSFDTLLTEYVKQCGGDVIIKGLRAVSDFEYELQLSSMNRKLDSSIETVF
ncbi:MAG: pantetheine-phosphate adenylyltransferase, partial [Nitrospinota bacterium]